MPCCCNWEIYAQGKAEIQRQTKQQKDRNTYRDKREIQIKRHTKDRERDRDIYIYIEGQRKRQESK